MRQIQVKIPDNPLRVWQFSKRCQLNSQLFQIISTTSNISTYGIPTSHRYCKGPAAIRLVKSHYLTHTPAIYGWRMQLIWSPAIVQEKETWWVPFSTIPARIRHMTNREIEMRHSLFWCEEMLIPSNSPWCEMLQTHCQPHPSWIHYQH